MKVDVTGVDWDGNIKPGGTMSIALVVSNNGDTDSYAFIEIVMPSYGSGTPAYSFTADSGWTLVEDNGADQVWGYGAADSLTVLSPMSSTSALTEGLVMNNMNGAEFQALGDVNVSVTGYLIQSTAGTDPADVWSKMGT